MRLIALMFFAAVFALSPYSAAGQCSQWDVTGPWVMSEGKTSVSFNIKQTGSLVSGQAQYATYNNNHDPIEVTGDVDGSVQGNKFTAHVYWNYNGLIGVYDGSISPQGRLEGDGYGEENPTKKFIWFIRGTMTCVPSTPASTGSPITHTGVRTTGRAKVTTPPATPVTATEQAVKAEPEVLTPPGIMAAPNHVPLVKGKSKGTTTLTWDAGRTHSAAELWVKVDDADIEKVAGAPKGTLQVPVIPGKTYLYSLIDPGKTLAVVLVEFHR